jgi:hypothetical protein
MKKRYFIEQLKSVDLLYSTGHTRDVDYPDVLLE